MVDVIEKHILADFSNRSVGVRKTNRRSFQHPKLLFSFPLQGFYVSIRIELSYLKYPKPQTSPIPCFLQLNCEKLVCFSHFYIFYLHLSTVDFH